MTSRTLVRYDLTLTDFQMYLVASGIIDKKKKRALLLYQTGPRVREIFRQLPNNGNDDDFGTAVEKLTAYFEPQKHRLYDFYQFRQAKQGNTETLDQYYTRLRNLSQHCDFTDSDFEILLQIVLHGTSSRLRKQALRDPKITLESLLVAGRQLERSTIEARHIEENAHQIERDNPVVQLVSSPSKTNTCRNCGGEWPHTNNPCPAKNKACRKCNKLNHFAMVCRSGNPHNLSQYSAKQQHQRRPSRNNNRPVNTPANDNQSSSESSDSEGYCYAVKTNPRKSPITKLKIIIKRCNSLWIPVQQSTLLMKIHLNNWEYPSAEDTH